MQIFSINRSPGNQYHLSAFLILNHHLGLAGCGAILVRDRNKQISHLFDFLCPAPGVLTPDNFPNQSRPQTLVGIPGLVRGLAAVHQQFGQKKWSDLFNGALQAASGFVVSKPILNFRDFVSFFHQRLHTQVNLPHPFSPTQFGENCW